MKRVISIIILLVFSSVAFAEDVKKDWKWDKIYSSVVLISSQMTGDKIITEPVPEEFFDDKNPDKRKPPDFVPIEPKLPEFALGTGFFINKIHVVTNYHVIKNFDSIKIYAYDHPFEISDIKIIGYDEEIDIAVIEVNEDIPHDYIKWADKVPYIGDRVYALGHGMNQIWSLTDGILSYNYRAHPNTSFVHYWQTDAVINSGNSGGPLLNENGEVIGVATLLISPDKYYVGYGYVIPWPLAKRAVNQILGRGEHNKPSIGIMMGITNDRELYEKLRADGINHYLEIREIIEGSAANRFGLLAGDIIVSIDDEDIQVLPNVIEVLWERNAGDQISIKVYRNGEYKTIDLVLGKAEPIVGSFYRYGDTE